jgi:carbon monoxide dehydrogenase subunit G
MALEVAEKFQVRAPVERVWQFLLDPRQVVTCLPGAELTEVIDARNFTGNMKVKVGPVTVVYKGKLQMVEVDEAARRVKMVGEGTEKSGGGSAKMAMECVVRSDGEAVEVAVSSKVDLVGKLVQFGRGMMLGVAQQLFKQFSERARALLETAAPVERAAPVEKAPVAEAAGGESAVEKPSSESTAPLQKLPPVENAAPATKLPPPSEPVNAFGLVWKALWASIVGWFRRLFGKSAD